MARQVQGTAKPGKSARGDVRKKSVQSSLLQSRTRQPARRRRTKTG